MRLSRLEADSFLWSPWTVGLAVKLHPDGQGDPSSKWRALTWSTSQHPLSHWHFAPLWRNFKHWSQLCPLLVGIFHSLHFLLTAKGQDSTKSFLLLLACLAPPRPEFRCSNVSLLVTDQESQEPVGKCNHSPGIRFACLIFARQVVTFMILEFRSSQHGHQLSRRTSQLMWPSLLPLQMKKTNPIESNSPKEDSREQCQGSFVPLLSYPKALLSLSWVTLSSSGSLYCMKLRWHFSDSHLM